MSDSDLIRFRESVCTCDQTKLHPKLHAPACPIYQCYGKPSTNPDRWDRIISESDHEG